MGLYLYNYCLKLQNQLVLTRLKSFFHYILQILDRGSYLFYYYLIKNKKRLSISGLTPSKINAILITHEHSDHIRGVSSLAKKYKIPVMATAGTSKFLRNSSALNLTYIDTKKNRLKRARDIMNEFNEQVLNIEHLIIKEHLKLSNMIIDSKLNIKIQ
mgnify:CR=1 FL=1